ncbi:ABC transporter ATP-binding protein [Persicitalea sp.]|uniref:ABC transporter ATP-binding protein n=1 Tax=Persicitalea sp. TaxID=3100273 RepID=UPI003593C1F3
MLKAINLRKEYPGNIALAGLDLHIQAGEVFCLLGANGAGKTTTINLFMGFTEPTSGQALVNDLEVAAHPQETKKFIAYIPENVMLYPGLTGVQNLAYLSGLSGKAYSDTELVHFLNRAGLQTDAQKRRVSTYSKGMRQKVGIALAIAKQARALFLDEPTSGLDPLASNEFSSLIKSLGHDGVAVLMVTHDLFRAKEIADRIGIMRLGELVSVLEANLLTHQELEATYLRVISSGENLPTSIQDVLTPQLARP